MRSCHGCAGTSIGGIVVVRRRGAITTVVATSAVLMVAGAVLVLRSPGRRDGPAPTAAPSSSTATTARPRPAGGSWVTVENRRPGTSGWRITHAGPAGAIEGWADQVSAAPGGARRHRPAATGLRRRAGRSAAPVPVQPGPPGTQASSPTGHQ